MGGLESRPRKNGRGERKREREREEAREDIMGWGTRGGWAEVGILSHGQGWMGRVAGREDPQWDGGGGDGDEPESRRRESRLEEAHRRSEDGWRTSVAGR